MCALADLEEFSGYESSHLLPAWLWSVFRPSRNIKPVGVRRNIERCVGSDLRKEDKRLENLCLSCREFRHDDDGSRGEPNR